MHALQGTHHFKKQVLQNQMNVSRRRGVQHLLTLVVGLIALAAQVAVAQDVLGATLEVCLSCRVKDLPEIQTFTNDVLPLYPSVELDDVVGAEPVLRYRDAFGGPIKSVPVASFTSDAIIENLADHGLFMWTPKAEYLPLPIEPIGSCVAWRQTAGCIGEGGAREPRFDERCDVRITFDRSGFCECANGKTVMLDCEHDEGNCLQYCAV